MLDPIRNPAWHQGADGMYYTTDEQLGNNVFDPWNREFPKVPRLLDGEDTDGESFYEYTTSVRGQVVVCIIWDTQGSYNSTLRKQANG